MRNIVKTYVDKFRRDRSTRIRTASVLTVLALVVCLGVFWQLRSTGVAMANETYCGMEEHQHSMEEGCYEQVLVCGYDEAEPAVVVYLSDDEETVEAKTEEAAAESESHVHDESCYEWVLTCEIPEHTHTVECMIDDTADVETAEDWEATLPELTGIWRNDVPAVAQSQIGYTESEKNFQLAEDGETHQGYTRYGAWYGNEYGGWDAMFVSFVLYYAGIDEEDFPQASGTYAWISDLKESELYAETSDYEPVPGDIVFIDDDEDEKADTVAIVTENDGKVITVIQGDCDDVVSENEYKLNDEQIIGYGIIPEQDLDGEQIYNIEYVSDEPEAVEVEGPKAVLEDASLVFTATVDLESGYEISEVTVNGEEIMPETITASEDGKILTYEYKVEDVEEDMIVFLEAKQVIDGSGSVDVYERSDSYTGDAEYTLRVDGVPTNTKISLDSPHITLTYNASRATVTGVTLKGSLYYVTDSDTEGQEVAYLMLDDNVTNDEYVVTAYGESGNAMSGGRLVLVRTDGPQTVKVEVWPIQINTLCYLDEENITVENRDGYTQALIGATAMTANAQTFTVVDNADATVDMTELTGKDEFYYGSLDKVDGQQDSVNLTKFTTAKIVLDNGSYLLEPLDENNKPVSGVSLYMVYDEVYSFDVEVTDVVNEHTEDNGDTYLWLGDTFYIDQYHAQGIDTIGYTRSQGYDPSYPDVVNGNGNTYEVGAWQNSGIWVQLGRARESEIKNGTASFTDYETVSYDDIKNRVSMSKNTSDPDYSYDGKDAADSAEENAPYGIVGPYSTKTENGEYDEAYSSEPITTTVRVTGHEGDEFTTLEVFGTNIVYMVTSQELQKDWINLGSHASDRGYRAWFYWINDYYLLNNHRDQVEYLEIYEDENGEIRLDFDEMGESGNGDLEDYWDNVQGLYTKRNSVIKQYMLDNKETLKNEDVGFADTAGWMEHVQLRMYSTVETIIDGEEYSGTLTMLYTNPNVQDGYVVGSEGYPKVEWDINSDAIDHYDDDVAKETAVTSGSVVLGQDNDQESKQYEFGFYIDPEYAFDPDYVKITVTIAAYGTLTSKNDPTKTIVYTEENPLVYEFTMTEAQLREAYDDCPNSEGYDVAINVSEAAKIDVESTDQIILYKIWDDENNRYETRNNVESVSVTLECSTDGTNWETVYDSTGNAATFTIAGDKDADSWSAVLTSNDLDLTYTYTVGEGEEQETVTAYYQFRIKDEEGLADLGGNGYAYTYETDGGLTVTNALTNNVISVIGVKMWVDDDGSELEEGSSLIPDSVVIAIYQNDEFYSMTTVTADDDWAFTFDNLPEVDSTGTKYEYTICEMASDGTPVGDGGEILLGNNNYTVTIIEGAENSSYDYDVTNIYTPYRVNILKYDSDLYYTFMAQAPPAQRNDEEAIDYYYLYYIDDDGITYYVELTHEGDYTFRYYDKTTDQPTSEDFDDTFGFLTVSSNDTDGETYYIYGLDLDKTYYIYHLTNNGQEGQTVELSEPTLVGLEGAKFILSKEVEGIIYYAQFTENTNDDGSIYFELSEWTTIESEATTLISGSDGYIHLTGLSAGRYILTETEAPNGYIQLSEPIEFTIDEGELVTETDIEVFDGELLVANDEIPYGAELPMTGGLGNNLYTMAGLLLICGAAYLLYSKNRRERRYAEE